MNNDIQIYTPEETKLIKQFYEMKAQVEILEKEKRKELANIMRENGIDWIENDDFRVSYVGPSVKKIVDTQKLKDDGIYDIYTKESNVSESVRITVKWQNDIESNI